MKIESQFKNIKNMTNENKFLTTYLTFLLNRIIIRAPNEHDCNNNSNKVAFDILKFNQF